MAVVIISESSTILQFDNIPEKGTPLGDLKGFDEDLKYVRSGMPLEADDLVFPNDQVFAAHPSDNG